MQSFAGKNFQVDLGALAKALRQERVWEAGEADPRPGLLESRERRN